MPVTAVRHPQLNKSAYEHLRKQVQQTLLLGQRRIEAEKVRTYWQTGKLIHEHLLQNKDRADYGSQVIQKLAEDLEINRRVLYHTLQFYRAFPIVTRGSQSFPENLTWSHYRNLLSVPDETQRRTLADLAARREWTAEQLRQKIQMEVGDDNHLVIPANPLRGQSKARAGLHKNGKKGQARQGLSRPVVEAGTRQLTPRLGRLYTYRLLKPVTINKGKESVWLDLGFNNHTLLPNAKGFREGQIVEASADESGNYEISASDRTEKDLYTYKAVVERVIDGDTLIVLIDQGFNHRTRHYLRLRAVNCPELETGEGKRAKAFIERELARVPHIVLTSTRSDKYGRYLADVHIPSKTSELKFLNQLLLDKGLAVKV